jgi:adenosine deaminase
MNTLSLIKALPKAEQHIHIVGAIRPTTLLWLYEDKEEPPFKSLADVERFFHYRDFDHFISVYGTVMESITNENQFERITYEMLEDEYNHNVHHVEASFSAADHMNLGLDYGHMIKAINRGIKRARLDFGIKCNIRIDLVRNYGPDTAREVLDRISPKRDNVVSVDIGGTEKNFPPEQFKQVFKRAKEMGLHLAAHAGEAAGPESIWKAIKHLNVERIGHGTSARKDAKLMENIIKKGITIETCPISNVRTGVIKSVKEHPIREFIRRGINVTVNSDDPTLFGTDINNEYLAIHQNLGFTVKELFKTSLNAVESAFIPTEEIEELRKVFIRKYQQIIIK